MKNSKTTPKQILNAKFTQLLFVLAFSLFIGSCNDDDQPDMEPEATCDTSLSAFDQLYMNELSIHSYYEDEVTMDLSVHAYSFTVSSDKVLCKIGYQAQPSLVTDYEIRIIDVTNGNNLVYSSNHTFSEITTSYEDVGGVPLQANVEYQIEREYDPGNFTTQTIGRLMSSNDYLNPLSFPMVYGDLTITGSVFYGYGGPVTDTYLPYIDLVFEN